VVASAVLEASIRTEDDLLALLQPVLPAKGARLLKGQPPAAELTDAGFTNRTSPKISIEMSYA